MAIMSLLVSGGASAWTGGPNAEDSGASLEFNESFLQPGGGQVDLSRFNRANVALPGQYRADVIVNEQPIGRFDVRLRAIDSAGENVQPCFDAAMLERIGADPDKLTPDAMALLSSQGDRCITLPQLIDGATATFDNGEQQLLIGVPQVAMRRLARGYVDPRFWDDGVTAGRLQYNANAYRSGSSGESATTQRYLGLNAGFNIGPWRLRHGGNLTDGDHAGSRYQRVQTSVQRGFASIRSQLTLGEAFTDGAVFDSYGFRGVQLASDDRMYPESQRGYAPTVRGIANSNARVQIRQNASIIYETTVSAGAFQINDLYPTGYGGDLEVIVTEADGSVHVSRVPFAPAVNALRPGVMRYSLTAGEYRNDAVGAAPFVLQGTLQYGISNLITAYGGAVASDSYAAAALGAAFNARIGAVGVDVTQARTRLQNRADRDGQSVRLSYSKLIEPTNTNIAVAAYRYSSRTYLGMQDAFALRERDAGFPGGALSLAQRGRLQLTLNQTLPGGYGTFFLSGYRQDYWGRRSADTQFQAGYNNNFKRVNLGLIASRQFDLSRGAWDNQVMVTVGIPLGRGPRVPYSTTSLQRKSSGATLVQEAMTGTVGADSVFAYGINAGLSRGGDQPRIATVGGNAAYAAPFATLSASASRSGEFRQASVGLSGGVVVYGAGAVFTSGLGDTVAIIEADGARGARVANGSGLRVDRLGRSVVSSLQPFASNTVEIDPKGLPINVEIKSTQQLATPTAGAITVVRFETASAGRAAILRARMANGEPVPFAADVVNAAGDSVGTVAQGGKIIARNLQSDSGELTVRWGSAAGETCSLRYALPKAVSIAMNYTTADATCN